jgi:hypothetical protein
MSLKSSSNKTKDLGSSNHTKTKQPVYLKYAKTASQDWLDPAMKLRPSDLSKPSLDVNPDDYPLITNFNNIMDTTVQAHSTVDVDQPIFQPAPKIVVFEDYEPFTTIKKKLFFRNIDSVWLFLPFFVLT